MSKTNQPWGFWPGTVASATLAEGTRVTGYAVSRAGDRVAWTELTPTAGGGTRLYVAPPDNPDGAWQLPDFSPRSNVHEYGGLAVWAGTAGYPWLFIEDSDQGIWALDTQGTPHLLQRHPDRRYGDCSVHAASGLIACLEEEPGADRTRVILLDTVGGERRVIAEASAFCNAPRLSPDGEHIAWIAWDPPAMPWTQTKLWVMTLATGEARPVTDGTSAVIEPRWRADGTLTWLDDRDGWWQLYRLADNAPARVNDHTCDLGRPPWQLGFNHHVDAPEGGTFVVTIDKAQCGLARIDASGQMHALDTADVDITQLHWDGQWLWYLGAPVDGARALRRLNPATGTTERVAVETPEPDPATVSHPVAISASGPNGDVHGFLFRPFAPDVTGPPGKAPPMLVRAHGGPTAMRSPAWSAEVEFWTSRGFAVLEVNYGGSSGHGRAYRERLRGSWGITDRDDCIALTEAMIIQGEADARYCFIAGNSAGGLTVLNALRTGSIFTGGLCRWGVTDLLRLAELTHRFEQPYLAYLIGDPETDREHFEALSPAHHADEITANVLFIQGENDRVVPPSQAREMVEAMRTAGSHAEQAIYPQEGHGLRRAEHIRDAIERELAFLREDMAP